jgi:hypothetical protein
MPHKNSRPFSSPHRPPISDREGTPDRLSRRVKFDVRRGHRIASGPYSMEGLATFHLLPNAYEV